MTRVAKLKAVDVSGKPFEMGQQIGRICHSHAAAQRRWMTEAVKYYTGMSWRSAVDRARRYLPYAADFYPDYIDEIRGYADGARMEFEEVFTMCCSELCSIQGFRGCTDVVVSGDLTSDGRVLACHNEDWNPAAKKNVVLIKANPHKKPSFISTSYAGLIPSTGMNDRGVCITGNALNPNDVRVGIPKLFPVRRVLEATSISEALRWAVPRSRASSYNNICSHASGEIYSLEGSATDCAWIYATDGYIVHTNHYTADKMEKYEKYPGEIIGSIVRYNRATRLLGQQRERVTIESMQQLLADHVNLPESICSHADSSSHPLNTWETIFSVIYDLTELGAYVCKGHPCEGRYYRTGIKKATSC